MSSNAFLCHLPDLLSQATFSVTASNPYKPKETVNKPKADATIHSSPYKCALHEHFYLRASACSGHCSSKYYMKSDLGNFQQAAYQIHLPLGRNFHQQANHNDFVLNGGCNIKLLSGLSYVSPN